MLSEETKILMLNKYKRSGEAPFNIYADLECLIKKFNRCGNNSEHSYATKVGEYIPSSFSMYTISSLKSIENKLDVYRGKDCMKTFCESLRKHARNIIHFKKKKLKVINK